MFHDLPKSSLVLRSHDGSVCMYAIYMVCHLPSTKTPVMLASIYHTYGSYGIYPHGKRCVSRAAPCLSDIIAAVHVDDVEHLLHLGDDPDNKGVKLGSPIIYTSNLPEQTSTYIYIYIYVYICRYVYM